MLKDNEVNELRANKQYKTFIKSGLKGIGTDIIRAGEGEFRTDVSFILRAGYLFIKNRVIRKELSICVDELLCKFIDFELNWPRTTDSIKQLCEKGEHGFIWMRYDFIRVNALFLRTSNLISTPELRSLIKEYSSIDGTKKNNRLLELQTELKNLHEKTILSIKSRGIFDDLIDIQKDAYYKQNEEKIIKSYIESSHRGNLGIPPNT